MGSVTLQQAEDPGRVWGHLEDSSGFHVLLFIHLLLCGCCFSHMVRRIKGWVYKEEMSLPGPSLPGYPPAPCRRPVSQSDCRSVAWAVSRDTGSTGGVGTLSPSCLRAPFSPQDTVSVHRPSFYAERFFKFMSNTVFRKNSCELPRPLARRAPRGAERGGGVAKSAVNPEPLLWPCGRPWASVGHLVQRTGESGRHRPGAQLGAWGPLFELEFWSHRVLPL